MKTIVMGMKVNEIYKVYTETNKEGKFLSKPKILLDKEEVKYEEIASYEGYPQSSSLGTFFCPSDYIYLSEEEKVRVTDKKFRVDLGCWYQYTDKIISKKDNCKKCEKELKTVLKTYNVQKIEADPKAKAYCDLHKLDYAETDYEELMKIIVPESNLISKITVNDYDFSVCHEGSVLRIDNGVGKWWGGKII